jgi:2-polyprenyl-3-methyl-5-hydroxy-6-metoxy-1,4-benzoquinol methylase
VDADTLSEGKKWDVIVLDRRKTPMDEYKRLAGQGFIIGLDEGGPARNHIPYIIDILPGFMRKDEPNISSIRFLELPHHRKRRFTYPFKNVLITFGGEDPEDLTHKMVSFLKKHFHYLNLSVCIGPSFHSSYSFDRVKLLHKPENLKEELYHYDLIITSCGLTCFEALSAKVPVILLNPSRYHQKMSESLGFPDIGVKKPIRNKFSSYINNKEYYIKLFNRIDREWDFFKKNSGRLAEIIMDIAQVSRDYDYYTCQGCGNRNNPVIGRSEKRTFFRCSRCGLIYALNFSGKPFQYDRGYFFTEYRKQYGKTYLEDFNHIKERAFGRINRINRLKEIKGKKILDIGCAFGPFLQAALEKGAEPLGLEVSKEASEYVKKELKIDCICKPFEDVSLKSKYDVITMWYVLEHFKRIKAVLEKVNRLLNIDGVFAFSTPSSYGISSKKNLRIFLKNNPADHHFILSPKSVKKILKRYGFKIGKIIITGHHPERFPFVKNLSRNKFRYRFLLLVSKAFKLGDTFEVYARKVEEFG